jgi:serine/threonine protein phosphatase PrpC
VPTIPGLELYGKTDTGRCRRNNEDWFAVDPELSLGVVSDGMGGAACGEVAAELTVNTILEHVRAAGEGASMEELLRSAIQAANRRVRTQAREQVECAGMGCTVVLALCRDGYAWIANVGDSRAYFWRGGVLRQISYDQNLANELRANLGLTEEQLRTYPHRHVLTMAIGTSETVAIRLEKERLQEGDVILLCSDGLYGAAGDEKIRQILAANPRLDEAVDQLIGAANEAGGPDNITVVLLRYPGA